MIWWYNMWNAYYQIILLVSSVILPTAVVMFPGITQLLSDEGIVKLRSNVSDSSAMTSLVNDTLIVVLVVLAAKVAIIGVEV